MSTDDPRAAVAVGELFAGYGGLGMGVAAALGGEVRWVSDIDKGPSKVLAHRFPDAPNHGDITKIKWTPDCPKCGELLALYWNNDMPEGRGYYCPADGWFDLDLWRSEPGVPEPVEILTGGSPCQDLSTAGKRAGMTDGTRSNLWVAMREAIAQLRPGLVVWENVRGALSASADSAVEPCAGCVGDGSGHVLRALGRVLGDLSELGYDAAWCGLRAADVGAAHGRFRVFIVAWPADAERGGRDGWAFDALRQPLGRVATAGGSEDAGGLTDDLAEASVPVLRRGDQHGAAAPGGAPALLPREGAPLFRTPTSQLAVNGGSQHPDKRRAGGHGPTLADEVEHLLPSPRATDGTKGGPNQRGSSGDLMLPSAVAHLPPTPAVNDMGRAYTPEEWDAWCAAQQAKHGNGNGHGKSLEIEAQRLLPTPGAADGNDGARCHSGGNPTLVGATVGLRDSDVARNPDRAVASQWGDYAAAIARWEAVLGRPAPAPTMTSAKGNPQLSPRFTEWLMGLPDGWITDVPGITRNEALKACGNGVVPQQAEAAIRWLWQYLPASVRAGLMGAAA